MGQVNQGFPRQVRLLKTDDFSSVFGFRKRINGQFLVIHYQPNHLNTMRLGVVVAKKSTRLAVKRNYMKRVLRDLFRKQLPNMHVAENQQVSVDASPRQTDAPDEFMFACGFDLIIRTQKTFTKHDYLAIKTEFNTLLKQLHKQSIKLNVSASLTSAKTDVRP